MQPSYRCNILYHLHMPYILFNALCFLTRCLSLLNQVNMDSSHFVKSVEAYWHLCAKDDIIFTLF